MKVFIDLWKRCPLWKSMFSRYQGITVNKDWMRIVYIAKCHQWPIITSFSSIGSATFLSYMVWIPFTIHQELFTRCFQCEFDLILLRQTSISEQMYSTSDTLVLFLGPRAQLYIYNSRIGYTKYSITEKRQNTIDI